MVATYNFSLTGEIHFASPGTKEILDKNAVGECANDLFEEIKVLDIGEIRNCYVRDNILSQKFIIYRHFKKLEQDNSEINQLVGVYPRDNYYLKIGLSGGLTPELEYFLESIVFLE